MASRLGPARPRAIGCERRRGLGDPLAIPAGKFLAARARRLSSASARIRAIRHSLVEFAQVRAAAFTAGARRRIDDALARKIVRQRPARRLNPGPFALLFVLLRSSDFGLGLFLGLSLLEIGDGELELLDELLAALRGLPELLPPGLASRISAARSRAHGPSPRSGPRPASRAARGSAHGRRQGLSGADRKASSRSDSIIFATEDRVRFAYLIKQPQLYPAALGRQVSRGIRQSMPSRR